MIVESQNNHSLPLQKNIDIDFEIDHLVPVIDYVYGESLISVFVFMIKKSDGSSKLFHTRKIKVFLNLLIILKKVETDNIFKNKKLLKKMALFQQKKNK